MFDKIQQFAQVFTFETLENARLSTKAPADLSIANQFWVDHFQRNNFLSRINIKVARTIDRAAGTFPNQTKNLKALRDNLARLVETVHPPCPTSPTCSQTARTFGLWSTTFNSRLGAYCNHKTQDAAASFFAPKAT